MREFKSNRGVEGRQITLREASVLDLEPEAQVAIDIQLLGVDLTEYALRAYIGLSMMFWLEGPSCQNETSHQVQCRCYWWNDFSKEWIRQFE